MIKIEENILKEVYQPRHKESHKYDFGLLVVIGGSNYYSGSPALSSLAAMRAGVDMVHILAPRRAADIIASFSPSLAAFPLEEDYLTKRSVPFLVEMTKSAQAVSNNRAAVVLGGGLGRSPETREAVLSYLSQISVPVVIDADAIYAVSDKIEILKDKPFIITPHTYEFFVLTGKEVHKKTDEERIKIVKEEAERIKSTVFLKGKLDVISDGKEVAVNEVGSSYLSKGGTGDTLAGICGALLARGIDNFTAAQAGAFINGKAGEITANKFKHSLLATDLIDNIPEVLKRYG